MKSLARIANDSPFCESRLRMKKLEDAVSSPEAMQMRSDEIERLVLEQRQDLLRAVLQGHLDLRAAQERPVEVEGADGVERRQVRATSRKLETLVGEVTVARQLYQAPGSEGLSPLEAALALPEERYSYEVRRLVAEESAPDFIPECSWGLEPEAKGAGLGISRQGEVPAVDMSEQVFDGGAFRAVGGGGETNADRVRQYLDTAGRGEQVGYHLLGLCAARQLGRKNASEIGLGVGAHDPDGIDEGLQFTGVMDQFSGELGLGEWRTLRHEGAQQLQFDRTASTSSPSLRWRFGLSSVSCASAQRAAPSSARARRNARSIRRGAGLGMMVSGG